MPLDQERSLAPMARVGNTKVIIDPNSVEWTTVTVETPGGTVVETVQVAKCGDLFLQKDAQDSIVFYSIELFERVMKKFPLVDNQMVPASKVRQISSAA
jgi:hypothetical protein